MAIFAFDQATPAVEDDRTLNLYPKAVEATMNQKVFELAEKINAVLEGEDPAVVDAAVGIASQLRYLKQFGPKEPDQINEAVSAPGPE